MSIDAANEGLLRACAAAQEFGPVKFRLGDIATAADLHAMACQGSA